MIRSLPLILALAACSPDDAPTAKQTPVVTSAPTPRTSASSFPPVADLPRGLIGTWTADPAGRCTPGSEGRIVVEPKAVRFYESEARITTIAQVDPHSWSIDADVTGEGETRRSRFTLNLNEDGSLTRVEAPFPEITYTRCKVAP